MTIIAIDRFLNISCISQILNIAYAEDTNTDSYFRENQEFTTSYCYLSNLI